MSAAGVIACACCTGTCHECCYRVTISGLTFDESLLVFGVDQAIDPDNEYDVQVTETEGSINGTFIVCGSSSIPFATKTEFTVGGPTYCGYATVSVTYNPAGPNLVVTVHLPMTVANEENFILQATPSLSPEQAAIIDAAVTCDGFGTAEGDNTLTQTFEFPFTLGTGSVVVELVPTCDGANPAFVPDCSDSTRFVTTICDDEECPCGYSDLQPDCLRVVFHNASGTDQIYEDGVYAGGGTNDRAYYLPGTYSRSGLASGPWYRVMIIRAIADGPPDLGTDAAYLELACSGPTDDSLGTYTMIDPADWSGSTLYATLFAHQTTLTALSTATGTACSCETADDVYTLSIQCEIGTTPVGWVDITVTRTGTSCTYTGTNGTQSATLVFASGQWTATVIRASDSVLVVDAIWSGSGNDPTGTHTFNSTDAGYTGDTALDDSCGSLAIIIS